MLVGFGIAVTLPVETDTASVVEAAPDSDADAEDPVLPWAFWKNAEKVLPVAGAFTAKTMPDWQWLLGLVCLQYTQIGAVSLTVIVKVGNWLAFAITGMNPESKPACPIVLVWLRGAHGSAKELWVAVWFFVVNWNVICSPTSAVRLLGSNVSAPLAPTVTVCAAAVEVEVPVADPDAVAEAAVVYVVVCAEPLTVTVVVTVTTLPADAVAFVPPTALFLNWSNLLPGLMAKTMPC